MNIKINKLNPKKGSYKNKKRICRGIGSGRGKTGGRGHKGQKSRSGCKIKNRFEGGQTPLYRKIPKFGFKSLKKKNKCIPISLLFKFNINSNIDINFLKINKIISNKVNNVKILLDNKYININKNPLNIKGLLYSNNVKNLIISNGGRID